MEDLFIFIMAFTIVFIFLLVNYFMKRKHNELAQSKEIKLLIGRYKLNRKYLNYNSLCLFFVLINSLIISSVGTFVGMLKFDYIWQLLIGFALLMGLIYVIYGFIGITLKRKEMKNNGL